MKSYVFSRIALWTTSILILLNAVLIESASLGIILLILFSILASVRLGFKATKSSSIITQLTIGAWILLSAVAILGSAFYYFAEVSLASQIGILVAITACLSLFPNPTVEQSKSPLELRFLLGLGVFIGAVASFVEMIRKVQIVSSVRTVFDAQSPMLLVPLGIAALVGIALVIRSQRKALQIAILSTLFFCATVLAVITFPLGFGFDPFVHQATVAHIAEFGTITPKPFYYIGQYAVELFAHQLFLLPVSSVDAWLVPLLASLLLPATAYIGLNAITRRYAMFGAVSVLLIPLGFAITTTPQSLAYLFCISLAFLVIPRLNRYPFKPHLSALMLMALAALLIHPIAGIPAVLLVALCALIELRPTGFRTALLVIASLASAFLFPLAFLAQSFISKLPLSLTAPHLSLPANPLQSEFIPALDALYPFINLQVAILLACSVVATILIFRSKEPKKLLLPSLVSAILLANYLLMQFISFDFLIDYERANYTYRILMMAALFSAPALAITLMKLKERVNHIARPYSAALVALIALAFVANVYGAYPRHDAHAISRNFNLSQADLDAVTRIEADADIEPYVVLANQMVSAAALKTYGFRTYYRDNTTFYYPIPTSEPLYQFYLDMMEVSPRQETALAAMDFAGVDRLYLVVNDYWSGAEVIREQAKTTADRWFAVGPQNNLFVFVFTRPAN